MGKLWNAASDAAIKIATSGSSGEPCGDHDMRKTGKTKRVREDRKRHQYKCKNCGETTWKSS